MRNKTKIILGVTTAIVLFVVVLLAGIAGAIAYAWNKIDVPERAKKSEKAKVAGIEFAKGRDQNDCLHKGFSLKPPADSFDLSNVTFVEECLKTAAANSNFCDDVPLILNRNWFKEQCSVVDGDWDTCISTMIAKRNYCQMDFNK